MTGQPTREKYGATALMYACQQGKGIDVLHIIHTKPGATTERERTLKTALHYCAESGEGGVVSAGALLAAAPELINVKDQDGYSALHLSVIAGNLSLTKLLISHGADINSADNEGHTPAHWATVCGEIASLEYLLLHGGEANIGDVHGGCPLHYAAQMCGPASDMPADRRLGMASLRILLENGADPNRPDSHGRSPILWAASAGSSEAILVLVNTGANVAAADKDGLTALHCAASRGHTDCVETLISLCNAEVDVIDNNGCSALFYAVTLGHADATQCLLNHGANTSRQDRKGRTAMHCGAAKGQLETLRVVANWGGNMWQRTVRGDYPLHDAVSSGRRPLVLWLLSERPDAVNAPNNDGKCPLHFSAIQNNIEMCKALLDAGSLVNPVMRTSKGLLATPLDTALHKGHRGCAKYLQLHGGVPASRLNSESAALRGLTNRPPVQSEVPAVEPEDISKEVKLVKEVKSTLSAVPVAPAGAAVPSLSTTNELTTITTRPRILQVYVEDDVMIRRIRHHVGSDSSIEERVRRRRRKRKVKRDMKTQTTVRLKSISSGEPETESTEEEIKKSKAKDHVVIQELKKPVLEKASTEEQDTGRNIQIITATIHNEPSKAEESDNDTKEMNAMEDSLFQDKSEAPAMKSISIEVKDEETIEELHTTKEISDLNVQESVEGENLEENKNEVISESTVDIIGKTISTEASKEELQELSGTLEEKAEESVSMDEILSSKEEVKEENEAVEKEEEAEETKEEVVDEDEIKEDENKDTEVKVEEVEVIDKEEEEVEHSEAGTGESEKDAEEVAEVKEDESKGSEEKEVEGINDEVKGDEIESSEEKKDEVIDVKTEIDKEYISKPELSRNGTILSEQSVEIEEESKITTPKLSEEKSDEEDKSNEEIVEEPLKQEESVSVDEETVIENDEIMEENNLESMDIQDTLKLSHSTSESEERDVQKRKTSSFEILEMPVKLDRQTIRSDYNEQRTLGTSRVERQYSIVEEAEELIKNDSKQQDFEENTESLHSAMGGDSSVLPDSGIEPSPRHTHPLKRPRSKTKSRIPRACRRNQGHFTKDAPLSTISVTQAVQYSVRKYHLERRIFHQLLELKRLQIRAGRASEAILVKRLVDDYKRAGLMLGLQPYDGIYTFRSFEKYLYEQLRLLQSSEKRIIPRIKSSDDLERLTAALKKSRIGQEILTTVPNNPVLCTYQTHRCHHATHAYTGIPCAAYITRPNHHQMPKPDTGFLPRLVKDDRRSETARTLRYVDPSRPLTLELSHGDDRQIINLPTSRLDRSKRYFVTFTVRAGHTSLSGEHQAKHVHATSS